MVTSPNLKHLEVVVEKAPIFYGCCSFAPLQEHQSQIVAGSQ
jgi:hypothetical protein